MKLSKADMDIVNSRLEYWEKRLSWYDNSTIWTQLTLRGKQGVRAFEELDLIYELHYVLTSYARKSKAIEIVKLKSKNWQKKLLTILSQDFIDVINHINSKGI